MKIPRGLSRVGSCLILLVWLVALCSPSAAYADAPLPTQQLSIREINITGDEFVALQNSGTAPIDHLNTYWLGYTSTENNPNVIPSQQLPDVALAPGETFLLNSGSTEVCDAVGIDKLNFSLSNTSGTLSLRQLTNQGATSTFQTLQYVSWNAAKSSPTTGASYLHLNDESFVTSYETTHTIPNTPVVWYKSTDASNSLWQVGFLQSCTFTPVQSATTASTDQTITWQASDDNPPFTVVPAVVITSADGSMAAIPASDIGLKALQLSEILPNPASPQTDANDEFIELYNPNGSSFDLSGFKLQIASTTSSTTHSYTFPVGTSIAAKSFKAFLSSDTNLSLNNGGGKVWLIDPLGTVMSESDVYGDAKDGQSWIHTNSTWQWTIAPTLGSANKLATPATTTKSASATTTAALASVKGASTASANRPISANSATTNSATPIHPWIVAAVAIAALLYGAYEYRVDLANRLYQFRRYREARRSTGR